MSDLSGFNLLLCNSPWIWKPAKAQTCISKLFLGFPLTFLIFFDIEEMHFWSNSVHLLHWDSVTATRKKERNYHASYHSHPGHHRESDSQYESFLWLLQAVDAVAASSWINPGKAGTYWIMDSPQMLYRCLICEFISRSKWSTTTTTTTKSHYHYNFIKWCNPFNNTNCI